MPPGNCCFHPSSWEVVGSSDHHIYSISFQNLQSWALHITGNKNLFTIHMNDQRLEKWEQLVVPQKHFGKSNTPGVIRAHPWLQMSRRHRVTHNVFDTYVHKANARSQLKCPASCNERFQHGDEWGSASNKLQQFIANRAWRSRLPCFMLAPLHCMIRYVHSGPAEQWTSRVCERR